MESFDAIVVGAGPAGSVVALLLARGGRRVALIEKSALPRDTVCGEFVSAEGVEILRDLGIDSSEAAVIEGTRFWTARGECFESSLARGIGWSRRRLDFELAQAAARAGALLRERTRVTDPIVESGRVRGVRVRCGDRLDEWHAPVVVAADGRHSTMALALGLREPCFHPGRHGLFGFRCDLELPNVAHAEPSPVELFAFPGGYAGLCAIEGGRTNLAFVVERERLRLRDLRSVLEGNPALCDRLAGVSLPARLKSVGPLEFGRRPLHHAGVLFLGDAGGPIDPFTGEGISIAIETARLAAPLLLDATGRGALDAELGSRYRAEYARVIAPRMRRARTMGWFLRHPAPLAALLAVARRRKSAFDSLVAATRR